MNYLYIVGDGSKYNDMELRYSLRSVEKYGNPENVHIIGHKPDFIGGVNHIPYKETDNSYTNVWNKLLVGCREIQDTNIIVMNDDFFLLKGYNFATYSDGAIPDRIKSEIINNKFRSVLTNTFKTLMLCSLGTTCYENHTPMPVNLSDLYQVLMSFNRQYPMCWRSLYGNIYGRNVSELPNIKLGLETQQAAIKLIHQRPCYSVGDDFLISCDEFFDTLYPVKSRWEK